MNDVKSFLRKFEHAVLFFVQLIRYCSEESMDRKSW